MLTLVYKWRTGDYIGSLQGQNKVVFLCCFNIHDELRGNISLINEQQVTI